MLNLDEEPLTVAGWIVSIVAAGCCLATVLAFGFWWNSFYPPGPYRAKERSGMVVLLIPGFVVGIAAYVAWDWLLNKLGISTTKPGRFAGSGPLPRSRKK